MRSSSFGLAGTNALPTMAPWGGRDKIVGINPLGWSVRLGVWPDAPQWAWYIGLFYQVNLFLLATFGDRDNGVIADHVGQLAAVCQRTSGVLQVRSSCKCRQLETVIINGPTDLRQQPAPARHDLRAVAK